MFEALLVITDPSVLAFLLLGIVAGLAIGALPGFDVTTGVVLLLPITFALTAEQGMIFFTAMYCAGVFGGSITAILFGVPGTSESVITALEGAPLTRRGEPGRALGVAIVASALGGLLAACGLILVTPALADLAIEFGSPEYFALGVLGLVCVSAIGGADPLKGYAMAFLGVFLSTVGADQLTSVVRFHYGLDMLFAGFGLAAFFIGIFAAAEILTRVSERNLALMQSGTSVVPQIKTPPLVDYLRLRWTILRSAVAGTFIGVLPGTGASSAALIAYGMEVRTAKDKSRFGKGSVEGIAAAESANNAAAVGSFVPLLALGIPGSGTTAVLLSALLVHNVQPGPMLMQTGPGVDVFNAIAIGATLSIFGVLLLSVFLARAFAHLAFVPYHFVATGILTISIGGALSVGGSDQALIMLGFGVLGLCLRRLDYPITPLVLGFVLGPIVETYLRRALLMSGDQIEPLVSRPMTATLLLVAGAIVLWPVIRALLPRGTVR